MVPETKSFHQGVFMILNIETPTAYKQGQGGIVVAFAFRMIPESKDDQETLQSLIDNGIVYEFLKKEDGTFDYAVLYVGKQRDAWNKSSPIVIVG